jgi:predicted PurR-regulated permease PerM
VPERDTARLVPRWLDVTAGWSWRWLVIVAAFATLLSLLAQLSVVVLPLIIALILATLCVPPAAWLRSKGVPAALAAVIIVVGGLAAIVGLLAAIAPQFADQIQELETFGYDEERLSELFVQARETLASSSTSILTGLAGGLSAAISGITGTALLVVLLFFFVKDGDQITAYLLSRAPAHRRDDTAAIGRRAWSALSGYVRGTAAIAAIDAIFIGIGLTILGVPLVLPLTMLVFLGGFLPVVGALLAGMIAVLVALADGGLGTAGIALLIILAVQQLEGNVLQPMIMRRAVSLHPVVVLSSLAVGATVAGIVGAFLSLPIAAVGAAVGNELRTRHEIE